MQLVKNEWRRHLSDLSTEMIQRGIDRSAQECDWPPSIAEFRKLSEPKIEDTQFPSPYKAFQMADYWQDKFLPIKLAIDALGGKKRFGMMNEEEALRRFIPLYEKFVKEVINNNPALENLTPRRSGMMMFNGSDIKH